MTGDELKSMAAMKRRIAALTVDRNLALEFEDHAQTADRAAAEIDRLTSENERLRNHWSGEYSLLASQHNATAAERDTLQARVAELERELKFLNTNMPNWD